MRSAIPYEVVPGVPAFAGAAAQPRDRADAARDQPDHHPHPHLRQGLADARERAAGSPRREQGDARHPPLDPQPRLCRGSADPALRRRLPGGRRLPRHLAGRGNHRHHAARNARPRARGKDHPHRAGLRRPCLRRHASSAIPASTTRALPTSCATPARRSCGRWPGCQLLLPDRAAAPRWPAPPSAPHAAAGSFGRAIITTASRSCCAASSLASVCTPPEFLVIRCVIPS